MLKTLAKGYAYSHHPRLTFAALHPEEALHLRKMEYDLRHAYAPRLVGVIAVAVALPLGIWIGRRWAKAGAEERIPRATKRPAMRRRVVARSPEGATRPSPAGPARLTASGLETPMPGEVRRRAGGSIALARRVRRHYPSAAVRE